MSLALPAYEPAAKPSYAYSAPTEAEARLAIARQVGAAAMEEVWAAACATSGVRRAGAALAGEELAPVAAYLAAQDGVLRVVGRSLELRLRTFALLAPTAAVMPSHPSR